MNVYWENENFLIFINAKVKMINNWANSDIKTA